MIKAERVEKDAEGNITTIFCTYDADTLSKDPADGRKVKGTIHWVSAPHALRAEVRLYDRLFSEEYPDADKERHFMEFLNPGSLTKLPDCMLEPSLAAASVEARFQFERQGYFCLDAKDSSAEKPVFNRIVTLRDSWAKLNEPGV